MAAYVDDIPVYRPQPTITVVSHKVRKGETLETIAKKHKMPLDRLLALNRLPLQLQAGQKLIIESRTKNIDRVDF